MATAQREGHNPWHDLPAEEEYALLKNSMKLFAPDGTPIDIEATVIDPEWAEWMKDNQEPVESGKDDDALEAILAWQARELTANNCGTGGGGFKPGNTCQKSGKKGGSGTPSDLSAKNIPDFDPEGHYPLFHVTQEVFVESILEKGLGAPDLDSYDPIRGATTLVPDGAVSLTRDPAYAINQGNVRLVIKDKQKLTEAGMAPKPYVAKLAADATGDKLVDGTFEHEEYINGIIPATFIDEIHIPKSVQTAWQESATNSKKFAAKAAEELAGVDPDSRKAAMLRLRENTYKVRAEKIESVLNDPRLKVGDYFRRDVTTGEVLQVNTLEVPTFNNAEEELTYWVEVEATLNNCGTGGGGFKPGNSCAKGGGSGKIKDKHGVSYDVLYDDSTRTYSISRPGKEDLLEHGVRSGFATLKKNFSGVMSVEVQPEFRRRGLATALYTHIEQHLGRPLKENWATTPDGEAFWKSRNNPTANKSEIPTFSSPREELEYWTRIEESLGEE